MSTHNQQYLHLLNALSPIGTMIPTPGMPHSGNSSTMVASAVDTSMIATGGGNSMPSVAVNTGSLLPTANGSSVGIHGGSFNSSDGAMSNGYQQAIYLATTYGNSPQPLQQHYDQHQRPKLQGDGYGMSTPNSSGSGNFFGPVTSSGLAMNNQNLNPANLQSMSRTNSPLMTNQRNLHTAQQATHIKSQSIDQSEKMNFQASNSLRESILQSHHQQQFQQQLHQLQQQFVQHQRQQKQKIQQHQILLKNDSFGHSQLTSVWTWLTMTTKTLIKDNGITDIRDSLAFGKEIDEDFPRKYNVQKKGLKNQNKCRVGSSTARTLFVDDTLAEIEGLNNYTNNAGGGVDLPQLTIVAMRWLG
ncbi:putative histone acetyltransferase HAC-like 1 [Camellia lanceoleosa]|nr:putative histone acetyltransferase HAC-like 1 [Camellia lanceoleosa]